MPKNEPDPSDPLTLVGADCELSESPAFLVQCLAEEFLGLGHDVHQVMNLFRSPEFALAHRAWSELGDVRVFLIVSDLLSRRERSKKTCGATHA